MPDEQRQRLGSELSQPFGPCEDDQLTQVTDWLENGVVTSGLQVVAATIDVDGVGVRPVAIFRFALPTGEWHEPLALVMDPDQMAQLPALVDQASTAAIRAASS